MDILAKLFASFVIVNLLAVFPFLMKDVIETPAFDKEYLLIKVAFINFCLCAVVMMSTMLGALWS